MIRSFPKIFAIGTDYIKDIFDDEVEITEKVDGSQFVFGRVDGEVYLRSKGASLYKENPQKMFIEGVEYIESIANRIPNNMIFYAEYLKKPKHNSLTYTRIPKNHLILYGIMDVTQKFYNNLNYYAELFEIEAIPVIYEGRIEDISKLKEMLNIKSVLGGVTIEGIVVKNYQKKFLLGGQPMPIMAGKFVSEAFKEVHRTRWGKEETGKGKMETFFDSFRTEARWEKAIQHLREADKLLHEPRDIGGLIKEVHSDIGQEEKEDIKEWLWNEFKGHIFRRSTAGLPEWYKEKLMERSFN